jgi:hypothetical protein
MDWVVLLGGGQLAGLKCDRVQGAVKHLEEDGGDLDGGGVGVEHKGGVGSSLGDDEDGSRAKSLLELIEGGERGGR